jgi:hypothetical protein
VLDWDSLVVVPVEGMLAKVVGFIPDLLAGIYILVFGWLIARALQFLVAKFLAAVRFDQLAQKAGLNELLDDGAQKKISASGWFGALAFWITIFVSVVMALDRFRLYIASDRLDQLMVLFVSVFSAVVILTLGMFLSVIVARVVKASAKSLNIEKPEMYAGIMRWMILLFTFLLTLSQLRIPPEFMLMGLGIVFITLCITFMVAFGIGGRQWAAKVLDKLY